MSRAEELARRRFRLVLVILTLLAWAWFVAMAMHQSEPAPWLGRYTATFFIVVVASAILAAIATTAHFGPWFSIAFSYRWKVALAVLATTLTLGVLEIGCRLTNPLGLTYFEELETHARTMLQYDVDLGYTHRPAARHAYGRFVVKTNSLGMRDEEIEAVREGALRIALLGDSVAFAWGVENEQGVACRLEASLGSALDRPVAVLNTGVPSYNTRQQFKMLARIGDLLSPDLVLVLFVHNDVGSPGRLQVDASKHEATTFDGDVVPVLKHLAGRSWLYRLVAFSVSQSRAAPSVIAVDRRGQGWVDSMGALADIAAWCHDRSTPMIVCLYRTDRDPVTDALALDIGDSAMQHAYVFFDSLGWFSSEDSHRLRVSIVDAHPNARGHGILADHLAELILPYVDRSKPRASSR